jgi:uroporphyrinogen-III decarboxylase
MPAGGYYFDPVPRQEPFDPDRLDPQEWVDDMYHVYRDEELRYLEETAQHLYHDTDRALVGWLGEGGFGDIALVPGLGVRRPRGIRDPEQWIIAHVQYPDYVKGIYRGQCDIALQNLELLYEAVGDTLQVIGISGTDFGTQNGPFISPDMYRDIYQPFHRELNDWIHRHTPWKTFYHTCGSVMALLDDMVDAGVDILNPVQCSAAEMDPATLKSRYGDRLVFWGGGVDNQRTLPFGTPEEVRAEAESRCRILGAGGGFVFNPVHNVQPGTPMPNLMAMLEVLKRR